MDLDVLVSRLASSAGWPSRQLLRDPWRLSWSKSARTTGELRTNFLPPAGERTAHAT